MHSLNKIKESEVIEMMWELKKEGPINFINADNISIANELVGRGLAEKTEHGYALTKIGEKELMQGGGKVNTTLKTILVFDNGNLIKQIPYKTKQEAIRSYRFFKEHGMIDSDTGKKMENATFELLEDGGNIPSSAIEEGKQVELEHAHTIEAIKDNPNISVEKAAEMIAKDHLSESPDYYKKLKIVEGESDKTNNTLTCKCPTMEYHNKLTQERKERLGSKFLDEGSTITDMKTGDKSDITSVEHNGFKLKPQSSLSGYPRQEFFVPFEEIVDKHGRNLIEVGGYENTEPDHKLLIVVIKDIMACNIIKEQLEKINEMQDTISNGVEEPVEMDEEMAKGGIIGEVKAARNGVVREIRDVNGKILKKVYAGDVEYKMSSAYGNYINSENGVLFKQDVNKINFKYGGVSGVEELPNFYRVDIASPKNVKTCRVPQWATNIAESVKKGAKVTTCKKYKKWFLSSVLIPKDGTSANEAKSLASDIKDKIEHKKMEHGGVMYETGATSAKVNNLILFADTTRNLAEMRDAVLATIKSRIKAGANPKQEDLENRFKTFLIKTEGQYIREMGNTKEARKEASLSPAEEKEFLKIYAERLTDFENGGRTSEIDYDVIRALKYWGGLKTKGRLHFLLDHADYVFDKALSQLSSKELTEYKKLASAHWNQLPKEVQMAVEEHVIMGTYENGGELTDYKAIDENSLRPFIGDDIESTRKGILVLIDCADTEEEKENLRNQLKAYQEN